MERKNIAFQYGIHRSPSAANEGELSECINLEVHNGEITPSVMPEVAFTMTEGDKLLFVHKTGSYKNFIIQRDTYLCWFPDKDKAEVTTIMEITPTSIHAVVNTLIVLAQDHMEYILFKSEAYKPIGSKPPFCSISFGLQQTDIGYPHGNLVSQDDITSIDHDRANYGQQLIDSIVSFRNGEAEKLVFDLEQAYKAIEQAGLDSSESNNNSFVLTMVQKMTEGFHATTNKNKEVFSKMGVFTDSFFLRYAYRMYDGSHYMHSAPVFFPMSIDGPGTTVRLPITFGDTGTQIGITLAMPNHKLDYQIIGLYNEGEKVGNESLEDWKDIIKGLDVFVTKGIPAYNADSKVYGFTSEIEDSGNILYCGKFKEERSVSSLPEGYTYASYSDVMNNERVSLIFEKKDDDEMMEALKSASLFYLVSSINNVQAITKDDGKRKFLEIKENILTVLEQQELLEDDYDSHNEIIPSFAHVYNGRLNISGIRTKVFSGYPMESMVPYTYDPDGTNHFWYIQTTLEIEGREVTVVSESNVQLYEKPAFIYYPSPKVKQFTLHRYNGTSGDPGFTTLTYYVAEFDAIQHKLLNGSYYLSSTFGIGDSYTLITSSASPQPSGDPYISYPNKIYTSEVNNPFFFPLSGRNSIGTGEIIAITSNTKAISPGQFGEYPLIVFSSDGVWAMQTGEEGLYYSVHPISKDICINPNVLQTDGPVLFATENGLHSIVSDNVENISLHIKGRPEQVNIPSVDEGFSALSSAAADDSTFNEFIADAVFSFDYINRRVLISNPAKSFAYVLSMDSGMYSKLVLLNANSPVVLGKAINAYPEVFMQSGNDIYVFVSDKDNPDNIYHGIMITRPLVFSDPLAMKSVSDLRLIYHKTKEDTTCRYAMLVSNDGRTWVQRSSLRGRSFKYFRFAVYASLSDTDAFQGMSIMYDYRRTNKLR